MKDKLELCKWGVGITFLVMVFVTLWAITSTFERSMDRKVHLLEAAFANKDVLAAEVDTCAARVAEAEASIQAATDDLDYLRFRMVDGQYEILHAKSVLSRATAELEIRKCELRCAKLRLIAIQSAVGKSE